MEIFKKYLKFFAFLFLSYFANFESFICVWWLIDFNKKNIHFGALGKMKSIMKHLLHDCVITNFQAIEWWDFRDSWFRVLFEWPWEWLKSLWKIGFLINLSDWFSDFNWYYFLNFSINFLTFLVNFLIILETLMEKVLL